MLIESSAFRLFSAVLCFVLGFQRQLRGDPLDDKCGNISKYINRTAAIYVHITLRASSNGSCSSWELSDKESNKANDGESNDCASGLIWCLCNYTKQCYHQQSMFGSCEEELMFGYLAQIDSSGQYCTDQASHKSSPSEECWDGMSIVEDCTGPSSMDSDTEYCVAGPPETPLLSSTPATWLPVTIAFASLLLAVLLVSTIFITKWFRSKRKALIIGNGVEGGLVTPPRSLIREEGVSRVDPRVGREPAQLKRWLQQKLSIPFSQSGETGSLLNSSSSNNNNCDRNLS